MEIASSGRYLSIELLSASASKRVMPLCLPPSKAERVILYVVICCRLSLSFACRASVAVRIPTRDVIPMPIMTIVMVLRNLSHISPPLLHCKSMKNESLLKMFFGWGSASLYLCGAITHN